MRQGWQRGLAAIALVLVLVGCSGEAAPPPSGGSPAQPPPTSGPVISISGRALLIDGRPLVVKGLAYAPVPIGQGPSEWLPTDARIYARDVPLLQASGGNTVRTYAMIPSPDPGILAAAEQAGVYLMLGFPLDPYYATTSQPTQALDGSTSAGRALRARILDDFRQYVRRTCTSAQVIAYVAGNEVTLNYSAKFMGSSRDFYTLLAELAPLPRAVCGRFIPVTTAVSDANLAEIGSTSLAADDAALSALGFWTASVFRGCTMGPFVSEFAARSGKPLLIGEFGIDAYNQVTGREDQTAQANCAGSLWDEIQDHTATSRMIGGIAFEYADEFWKAGSPAQHDTGGFANGAFPDGFMNEEWWGLMAVAPGQQGAVDQLTPRAVYARLQQAWTGPVTITSPIGGTVQQTETVAGAFADLRLGDTIFVVVRNRFGRLYPQTFPATVSASSGTWQALAFFGDPGRNVGDTFQYFTVVSRDRALTNQLIAIGQTGGATTLPTSPFLISFAGPQTVTAVRQ